MRSSASEGDFFRSGCRWKGGDLALRRGGDVPVADPQTGQTKIVPGNQAVWAMAPVTVAWDVGTSPILGLGVLWLWATKFSG